MSNASFDERRPRRVRPARSGTGRTLAVVLLLVACATAAVVLRQTFGGFPSLYQDVLVPPSAAMQSSAPLRQISDLTAQPGDDVRQLVKDLQASLQQTVDRLELIQRQLAAEQGERKLLSEQVGALSVRVSGLSASNASAAAVTPPSPKLPSPRPPLPKKQPIPLR
jgi:hypothetical protein